MNNSAPSRAKIRSFWKARSGVSTNYKLAPWQRQAIADAYGNDEKTTAVAAEFGVTAQYVGQLGRRFGHKSRRVGRPPKSTRLANPVVSASFGSAP
jgi:hypothetical protein